MNLYCIDLLMTNETEWTWIILNRKSFYMPENLSIDTSKPSQNALMRGWQNKFRILVRFECMTGYFWAKMAGFFFVKLII